MLLPTQLEMSGDDTQKLNLDQLWLDPNIFNEDIALEEHGQSRSHAWQQRLDLRRESDASIKAGGLVHTPAAMASSSITPTDMPVRPAFDRTAGTGM